MELEEKVKEALRCGKDFAYWLGAYTWIEDKRADGTGEVKFELWESQKSILPVFLTATYLFLLKARQLGLTWLTAAYCLWLAIFHQNQLIVVISRKEQYAIEFLDRVKFIFYRLPEWMRPNVLKDTQQLLHFGYVEKDDKGNVIVKGLNSMIQSLTTTPEGAQSMTLNLLVLDEASLIDNIRKIWRSSKPGVDSAGGRAIIISNPNKDGVGWPWFREWYIKAWREKAGRIRHIFMPWWDHPRRDRKLVPDPDDPTKLVGAFIAQQKTEGYTDDDIAMAYPSSIEESIEAMTGSFFGDTLTRHKDFPLGRQGTIEENDEDELVFEESKRGFMTVWRDPVIEEWDNRHVIFSDVSEGLDQTASVAYLFDRVEEEFVAKMSSAGLDADEWGKELVKLAKWCGGWPIICPELSGAGQTTVIALKKEKYPRIYRHREVGRSKNIITAKFGMPQTHDNKKKLSFALRAYLRETEKQVPDSELIDQCATYIRLPNGHYGKEDETKRDDCVVAAGGTILIHNILPQPKKVTKRDRISTYTPPPSSWRERMGIEKGARDPWVE